jgi:hypothetical protein
MPVSVRHAPSRLARMRKVSTRSSRVCPRHSKTDAKPLTRARQQRVSRLTRGGLAFSGRRPAQDMRLSAQRPGVVGIVRRFFCTFRAQLMVDDQGMHGLIRVTGA